MEERTTLHVVHPYTYKCTPDGSLTVGPIDNLVRRDRKVRDLISLALEKGSRVLWYDITKSSLSEAMFIPTCISMDRNLKILLDERVTKITTTDRGLCIADTPPAGVSQKVYDQIKSVVMCKSAMRELLGQSNNSLFIGGFYDACLGNALGQHFDLFAGRKERVSCVREFCPDTGDAEKVARTKKLLERYPLHYISPKEAMSLLERKAA